VASLTVFLDANVLFSAAVGGPALELIWELARRRRIRLVTSAHCRAEAMANIERKRPGSMSRLEQALAEVALVPEPASGLVDAARRLLPEKDAPVLAAALEAGADFLVTGDLKHFGGLMKRDDLQLRVRSPRAFLLEGP
jgi:predicted nucleic acid-binding protein